LIIKGFTAEDELCSLLRYEELEKYAIHADIHQKSYKSEQETTVFSSVISRLIWGNKAHACLYIAKEIEEG